ncbi:unnamed protein product [Musa textilis]
MLPPVSVWQTDTAGAVAISQPGGATAPARRCYHPRLGGSTAWPIQQRLNGPCLRPNLAQ